MLILVGYLRGEWGVCKDVNGRFEWDHKHESGV